MFLQNLASYDYNYEVMKQYDGVAESWFSGGAIIFFVVLGIAVAVLMIAAMWRILTKAGRPGWAAIVPIYGNLQVIWAAGKPWWWIFILLIPIIGQTLLFYNLAKAFGKGIGYILLLVLLPIIGFPMLAWGGAKYRLKKPKKS